MNSGTCRKRFREPENQADEDEEELDDEDGCGLPRRYQPHRAVKRFRPSPVPIFPPEVWEYLFRFVQEPRELLRLRLVCQCWRDVIGGSLRLMSRFRVELVAAKRNEEMDGAFAPVGLPELVPRLRVWKYSIVGVGGWWGGVGGKLRELRLDSCRMDVGLLYGMLEQAVNLKSLNLYSVKLLGVGHPDFRLDRMKSLVLCYVSYEGDILGGLEGAFPNLEELALDVASRFIKTDVLQPIRSLQKTLKHLRLCQKLRKPDFLFELSQMKELRLKSIFLGTLPDKTEQWMRFCRSQPELEDLTVTVSNPQVLNDAGPLLPKLKSLTLTVVGSMTLSFLTTMPGLKTLAVIGDFNKLSFPDQACSNLEQFSIRNVETDDLFQFLQLSPNLQRLVLDDCQLGYRRDAISTHFHNLRSLTLDSIQCPNMLTITLLRHTLKLEELHLTWLKYVDDIVVLDFCKKLRNLRKLTMIAIRGTSSEAAHYVLRHCRKLEELYADFDEEMLERIERTRKVRIKRRVWTDTEEDDGDDDDIDFDEED